MSYQRTNPHACFLYADAQIKALDKGASEARKLLENMKCVVQKCQEATDNEKAIKESLKVSLL